MTLDSRFESSFGPHTTSHNLPNCTFLNFNLDRFLSGKNTRRLRKMLIQARWDEMRQKMQVVKNAYISRHYTQCAKYGERLLAEVQGEVSILNYQWTSSSILTCARSILSIWPTSTSTPHCHTTHSPAKQLSRTATRNSTSRKSTTWRRLLRSRPHPALSDPTALLLRTILQAQALPLLLAQK